MKSATVKICGLRSVEIVRAIRQLPIDHVGFVFAESKRQVDASQAGRMIAALREGSPDQGTIARIAPPLSVGVFVNPTLEQLETVLKEAPLDILQLHGNETPEFCQIVRSEFNLPVFKFMPISSAPAKKPHPQDEGGEGAVASLLGPYAQWVEAILLDTFDPTVAGGSGKTFAWERIPPYLNWARDNGIQLIVAGGLSADNVRQLIDQYQPTGVDVSSGVETNGEKDINKIHMFVERAKLPGSQAQD